MSGYLLRPWRRDDAVGFRAAVDTSLAELKPWMNWAHDEPVSLEETERRLGDHAIAFRNGERWRYAIVCPETRDIVGGASIHRRVGRNARDIGYWLRTGYTGRGIATAAVRAVIDVAFRQRGVTRLEIDCYYGNKSSMALARRLGFRQLEDVTRVGPDGTDRRLHVFELQRKHYPTPQMLELTALPSIIVQSEP